MILSVRGHHVNFRYTPQKNINIMLGSFKTRGVASDTRTDDDYLKVNILYDVLDIGNIYAEYRYEEIQDNIEDLISIVDPQAIRSNVKVMQPDVK